MTETLAPVEVIDLERLFDKSEPCDWKKGPEHSAHWVGLCVLCKSRNLICDTHLVWLREYLARPDTAMQCCLCGYIGRTFDQFLNPFGSL